MGDLVFVHFLIGTPKKGRHPGTCNRWAWFCILHFLLQKFIFSFSILMLPHVLDEKIWFDLQKKFNYRHDKNLKYWSPFFFCNFWPRWRPKNSRNLGLCWLRSAAYEVENVEKTQTRSGLPRLRLHITTSHEVHAVVQSASSLTTVGNNEQTTVAIHHLCSPPNQSSVAMCMVGLHIYIVFIASGVVISTPAVSW